MISRSLLRYLAVGMANTAIGLALIFAAKAFARVDDVPANLAGYAAGALFGFVLNRSWTFRHGGNPYAAVARYAVVLAGAYLANLVTVLWAIDVLHLNAYVGQLLGVLPYVATGYLGMKLFAFAPEMT